MVTNRFQDLAPELLCVHNTDLRGMEHPQLIDTRSATVERVSERLIEVRFKPDVKLDAAGIGEMVQAKRALTGALEADVLTVVPPDLEFEIAVLAMDHHAVHGGCGGSRRLAFVAGSSLNLRLADIYFRYHPRPHETALFMEEDEARRWLDAAVPSPSLS